MSLILAALSVIALAQPAAPAAVPPPTDQTSANCANPVYASDQLVCSDGDLKARDAELAALISKAPIGGTALMESDNAWFARRSQCAFAADHRACLVAAYDERMILRKAMTIAPEASAKYALCKVGSANLGTRHYSAFGSNAGLVLRDANSGQVLAVLFRPAPKDAAWKPYASYTLRATRLSIKAEDGTAWPCRM